MAETKKFLLHFSHFLTGNALSLLLGFITFPILTRVLSREEYGILGLVSTTMLLFVAMGKSGLSNGIIRFYGDYDSNDDALSGFVTTVFLKGLVLSSITTACYLALVTSLLRLLTINKEFMVCFLVMSFYLFVRPLNIIVLNILRVRGKTILLNSIEFCGKALAVALSLFLFFYVISKFYGYFVGLAAAEITISIYLFWWFFSNYRIRFRRVSNELFVRLVSFGAPLLLTELSYLLLTYADRYMIVLYRDEAALGLYSVGYNLSMYIADLVTFSLSYSVVPIYVEVYRKEGKEATEIFLKKCLHYVLIGVIPICFGFHAVSKNLFVFLASEKYATASEFSFIILIGTLLLGLNNIFNAGLYLSKKTLGILSIMAVSVLLNVVLNMILLPSYGIKGAAIATLVAAAVSSVLTILISYRYLKVGINWSILYFVIISFVMLKVVEKISITPLYLGLGIQILTGIAIVVIGTALAERGILKEMVKRAMKRV